MELRKHTRVEIEVRLPVEEAQELADALNRMVPRLRVDADNIVPRAAVDAEVCDELARKLTDLLDLPF